MKKGLHIVVNGKVQGVSFRAFTQNKARQLDIKGWVKNLKDGRVEIFAFGDSEKLCELQQWLWQGSPHSHVTAVADESIVWQELADFSIR